MESTSRRDKSPDESSARSPFTPQVRAAMHRFLSEVDQKEKAETNKKINTMEGLCSAYKEHVKDSLARMLQRGANKKKRTAKCLE